MAFDDYLTQERARISAQQPQAPAYQFRDDRNAELDRQAGVQTAQAKANPFQPSGAASPFAPAKTSESGYEGFTADLEAGAPKPAQSSGNSPFAPKDTGAQVSGAISRLLSNPTGGFDQSAAIARQNAVKANQVQNEDLRNQAALQFMPGTGQSFAPVQQQTDQQTLAMRDFDAKTAADRATTEQQGLQTGASLGLQQEGQRISADQAAKQLAETSRQFNEMEPIQAAQAKSAADIAAGNLGVSQGQLALNTQLGQGQLGLSQAQLDLNKTLGLGNLSLEQQKVANQASQFASQEDFQKYALQAGMDQHTADLAWQANQTQIQQKWQTGERLSSQEFTTLINQNQQTFDAAQNDLNRTLQLDVQGNQQKFEAAQTVAAQAYDSAKTDKAMSHEDALAASQQVFQKEMQAAGFTNDQILQASQLTQQANIAKQQMDLQETMHMADLAQSDKQFGAKLGLDYAQIAQQGDQFQQSLQEKSSEFAQQFGLDEKQVNAALSSDQFKNDLERAQIGMELAKDNPDAMKPIAEQLARTMGKALGFTDDQITKGIADGSLTALTATSTGPEGSNAKAVADFTSIIQKTGGLAPADQEQLISDATKFKGLASNLPADKIGAVADTDENRSLISDGAERLKAKGITGSAINSNFDSSRVGTFDTHTAMSASQVGMDYSIYTRLIKNGLSETDAKSALASLLGDTRSKAALKLEGG